MIPSWWSASSGEGPARRATHSSLSPRLNGAADVWHCSVRRINFAEDEPLLISFLRAVVDGKVDPIDAVKAYHDQLAANGVRADRMLEQDLIISEEALRAAAA